MADGGERLGLYDSQESMESTRSGGAAWKHNKAPSTQKGNWAEAEVWKWYTDQGCLVYAPPGSQGYDWTVDNGGPLLRIQVKLASAAPHGYWSANTISCTGSGTIRGGTPEHRARQQLRALVEKPYDRLAVVTPVGHIWIIPAELLKSQKISLGPVQGLRKYKLKGVTYDKYLVRGPIYPLVYETQEAM